jgi:Flp pilus assembly protein TadG
VRGLLRALARDRSGSTAVEFAMTIPILIVGLFACLQFGILFFANSGLQNAVGEGARMATLWPRRTQQQIASEISASAFGLQSEKLAAPQFSYGVSGGQDYVDITLSYTTELNFLLFSVDGVTLRETRRAYRP